MAMRNSEPIVAISSNSKLEGGSLVYRKYAPLATELRSRGVRAIGLHGKSDYVSGCEFSAYYEFAGEGFVKRNDTIGVDATRDLTGGIARYTNVAALNPQATRDAVSSKKTQIDILRQSGLDLMPQTFFVESDDDVAIADALTAIEGDKVILKPEISQAGLNVISGTKSEVAARIGEYRASKRQGSGLMLVQKYMPDIKEPFSADLRFMPNEADNVSDIANNEIRVHVVDEEPVLFHGKTSIKGSEYDYHDSQLVFFDQDYWPPHVYELARTAARAFRVYTGDKDSYLTFDFTPSGRMMSEVNGKNPVAIAEREPDEAGYETHVIWKDMLAGKLASIAKREYAKRKGER